MTLSKLAEEAALDICWRQWSTLAGENSTRGIIDPEALVLASLALRPEERRLSDRLHWWAGVGSHFTSVQRLKSIASQLSCESMAASTAWFASVAATSGDKRWTRLANSSDFDTEPVRPGKGPRTLSLYGAGALMLKLRAGFGVGIKADLMAFLVGTHTHTNLWPTAKVVASALSYSISSVRRAASEMEVGGFIEASLDRPTKLSVDAPSWVGILETNERDQAIPTWRFWSQALGFLMACREWGQPSEIADVVRASRARDIVERFHAPMAWLGIDIPDALRYSGESYLPAFEKLVNDVIETVAADQ